jgi:hypothetical protein
MARSDRVEHPNPADSANRPVQPENPDRPVFRLTVMLKPGTSAPLVLELINAIKGQPEVADVSWDFAATEKYQADCELRDRLITLLGQISPL